MPQLTARERHRVTFRLNGRKVEVDAENRTLLTDLLRHEIGATGTHVGCEHGVCGACTVQVDGAPARACLILAAQIEGTDVRTVEALAPEPGRLSTLQAAFREQYGLQCGFCTPGILMTLDALLTAKPDADREDIREHLSGHLCRCTGYVTIVAAALAAVEELRKEQDDNA
ncbi:(2Fe-2S)-binding protein [Chelativorans sp. M5D2P16]|uniref:(2Fe-2S)-binding protein n=1 Tax=Chelativorans sp. M5D2P16 TaxID=3095678 RepID=UPI002ACA08C2|nr:(2Fe-2S)-binding protein [Chelativorans sp. M5D2P16]MDZ5698532.1 (2Fe-2S)-binding protein [Chelativorans sp. M5D2P16]